MSARNGVAGKLAWQNVTGSNPCPVCASSAWCSLSEGGDWCTCRRLDRHAAYGDGKPGTDSEGVPYWTYRLTPRRPDEAWPEPVYSLADRGTERADPDTLHKVYKEFVERLSLSAEHEEALRRRSNSRGGWLTAGYRTLGRSRASAVRGMIEKGMERLLPGVPGFFVQETAGRRYWTASGPSGILIPVRNARGQIVALMVRADNAPPDDRYRYLSSKKRGGFSPGTPVHVPQFVGDKTTVRVTEGALKADLATWLSGTLTIGLPGVGGYRRGPAVLRELGAKVVRVAFDQDARTNRRVARNLAAMVALLRKGFTTELEVW